MKNKTLQVMTKVSTSEHYDGATHAVIGVDSELISFISRQMQVAKQMAAEDDTFEALTFGHWGSDFINYPGNDSELRCDLTKEDFDHHMDSCEGIILPDGFVVGADERANIQPMSLHITATSFYWAGWDKYVGVNGHVETYRFSQKQLDDWREKVVSPGGLTWLAARLDEELVDVGCPIAHIEWDWRCLRCQKDSILVDMDPQAADDCCAKVSHLHASDELECRECGWRGYGSDISAGSFSPQKLNISGDSMYEDHPEMVKVVIDWLKSNSTNNDISSAMHKRSFEIIEYLSSLKKVVHISVEGGVCDVEEVPDGVEVIVHDYDTEGTDESLLTEDDHGTYIEGVYGD